MRDQATIDETVKVVCALQDQANEAMRAEQHEATIAAALALPEAERKRLWIELARSLTPAFSANVLEERRIYDRNRRIEFLQSRLYERDYHTISEAYRMEKELEELQRVAVEVEA